MTEQEIRARIREIEEEMSILPSGCVTRKIIDGKERWYHQYYVDGKRRSKIISVEEVSAVREKIERYNQLKQELKELKRQLPKERKEKVKAKSTKTQF